MKKENFMLSIVAPAYNESSNIDVFYERMKPILDKCAKNWEIVLINDGSSDDTYLKMSKLNQKDGRVKIIDLSRNFGKEAALSAGLDAASGDAIIPIDIDLQDPPELIPKMIEKWQEGYDMVYATRTLREGETFLKKFTASLFYKFINKISNINIPQNTGDFRLIDKVALCQIQKLKESNRFMKGLFSWVGFKQIGIEYVREPRFSGTSKFNYWKLWNFALEGITSFSIAPLQIATLLGLIVSVVAFIYGVLIIGKTIFLGADVPGYPSLMVTMLFLGGTQLITIGVIGEYVGRIYNEVKNRPIYIVKERVGFGSFEFSDKLEENNAKKEENNV